MEISKELKYLIKDRPLQSNPSSDISFERSVGMKDFDNLQKLPSNNIFDGIKCASSIHSYPNIPETKASNTIESDSSLVSNISDQNALNFSENNEYVPPQVSAKYLSEPKFHQAVDFKEPSSLASSFDSFLSKRDFNIGSFGVVKTKKIFESIQNKCITDDNPEVNFNELRNCMGQLDICPSFDLCK